MTIFFVLLLRLSRFLSILLMQTELLNINTTMYCIHFNLNHDYSYAFPVHLHCCLYFGIE